MIELNHEQMNKQKRMLFKLKFDLDKLYFNINHTKLSNIKCNIKKNIEMTLCKCRLVAPYLISLGITFGSFSIAGFTPFLLDDEKNNLKIMKEIDNNGNIRYETQYSEFENMNNTITYYSNWYKKNNMYARNIKVYNIGDLSENNILRIINSDYNNLDDIFGNPIIDRTELKENVDDINDSYVQARIYSEDIDDYIFLKQPMNNNVVETIIWLFITLIIELFIISSREYNYKKIKNSIIKKYSMEFYDNLLKKIEIRKNNYERLINFEGDNNINENIQFSNLNGLELQKLLILIDELKFEKRLNLNIDKFYTFGLELETEFVNKNKIIENFKQKFNCVPDIDDIITFKMTNGNWSIKDDSSLKYGLEINTPPLNDTTSNWNSINDVCKLIYSSVKIGKNSSSHIHIGSQILGNDINAWLNFFMIWSTYENIIYRFLYGEYLTYRPNILEFARPVSNELWNIYKSVDGKCSKVEDLLNVFKIGRFKAINLGNVNCSCLDEFIDSNTIELRVPNGTLDIALLQNNVNFVMKLLLYCKNKNFNYKKIENRHQKIEEISDNIEWYNEIYLEQALELCDLIFDNNLDKCYFLKQYLKSFKISKGGYHKSNTLTKKLKKV